MNLYELPEKEEKESIAVKKHQSFNKSCKRSTTLSLQGLKLTIIYVKK